MVPVIILYCVQHVNNNDNDTKSGHITIHAHIVNVLLGNGTTIMYIHIVLTGSYIGMKKGRKGKVR